MVLDEPRVDDETVHLQGIDFIYHRNESELFDQTFIDYQDSWFGQGFVVCSPASEPC